MTRSIEEAEELPAFDARVLKDIHLDGWQTTAILGREGDADPDFAYSIGFFHRMQHPEVILFGLPLETCAKVVNLIGFDIRDGIQYHPGRTYSGILEQPHECCFRDVAKRHYQKYIGYALWFYETDPFPLMQCFWSDEYGRFPWDPSCMAYARAPQPLLYLP